MQFQRFLVEPVAGKGVEGAKRFVEQEKVGKLAQGPGDGDPHPHPAAQLARIVVQRPPEAQARGPVAGGVLAGTAGDTLEAPGQGDVVANGGPGEQRRILENEGRVDLVPGRRDFARAGWQEVGDQPQQCRFAAAGRADDGDNFAGTGGQGNFIEDKRPFTEALAYFIEGDGGPVSHQRAGPATCRVRG